MSSKTDDPIWGQIENVTLITERKETMKNHIIFVNDHSGSMGGAKSRAAIVDYNNISQAFVNAAVRDSLDTIVSVVGVGVGDAGYGCTRQVIASNPNVLKPITTWSTSGGTPLWDGVGNAIELAQSMPDYDSAQQGFMILVTTDGEEQHSSKYDKTMLAAKIKEAYQTGRFTFVFRVPKGGSKHLSGLGIPVDNIQEWENTAAGLAAATAATTAAVDQFYQARAKGATSSSTFYSSTASVNTAALTDISSKVTLYINGQNPNDFNGIEIKDFILARRKEYMVGGAFYQLVKSERNVQPNKMILIRDSKTGKVYAGAEARKMIGLDTVNNATVHPNHGGSGYDIFIQSTSTNRKIGTSHGVLYWPEKGRPMTQADLEKYKKADPVAAPAPQLAQAPATGRPTKSTIPVTPMGPTVDGRKVKFFDSRSAARYAGVAQDLNKYSGSAIVNAPAGKRWFVFV